MVIADRVFVVQKLKLAGTTIGSLRGARALLTSATFMLSIPHPENLLLYLDKPPTIFKSAASGFAPGKGKLSVKKRMMCFTLLIHDTVVRISSFRLVNYLSSSFVVQSESF